MGRAKGREVEEGDSPHGSISSCTGWLPLQMLAGDGGWLPTRAKIPAPAPEITDVPGGSSVQIEIHRRPLVLDSDTRLPARLVGCASAPPRRHCSPASVNA